MGAALVLILAGAGGSYAAYEHFGTSSAHRRTGQSSTNAARSGTARTSSSVVPYCISLWNKNTGEGGKAPATGGSGGSFIFYAGGKGSDHSQYLGWTCVYAVPISYGSGNFHEIATEGFIVHSAYAGTIRFSTPEGGSIAVEQPDGTYRLGDEYGTVTANSFVLSVARLYGNALSSLTYEQLHQAMAAAARSGTSSSPLPTSTAPSTSTSAPSTSTLVIGTDGGLLVTACPTTSPISGSHRLKLPDPKPPAIPSSLQSKISVYGNDEVLALAPTGWNCTAAEGQDGNDVVTIYPPGQPSTQPSEAVDAELIPACSSCIGEQACAYFATAQKLLGGQACPAIPNGEEHVQTRPTSVDFADPPGVTGNGFASGGGDPANGVQIFDPTTGDGHAARETCTLPQSQHALCTAILDDFINRYAGPKHGSASSGDSPVGPSGKRYAVLIGLPIRTGASTSAARIGEVPARALVGVQCKVRGETIVGPWGHDPYWDRITFQAITGFVTDEWVDTKTDEDNPSKVPLC